MQGIKVVHSVMTGLQMNGIHVNGKVRGSEKAVPGCLGRMVNLFDLTSGVSGNRRLTDKPHNDDSLSRSQSDVSRMSSFAGDEMEDKVMVAELRRSSTNGKPNGTPVKMLIDQEMSKDLESRQCSPNVVAKLMGLDALPKQQSDGATQKGNSKCYTRKSHSEIPIGYWQEEHSILGQKVDSDIKPHHEQNEYKDIFEILQRSQKANCQRDKLPQKRNFNENVNDKKLSLIRQKFMDAKRLATDEKLRQTKEFQDAVDVLSSNGELFLKVLQEPNSLFAPHLYEGHSIPASPETKHITVLRPSKNVSDDKCTAPGMRDEKQIRKHFQVNQVNTWDSNHNGFSPTISTWKVNDSPTQPTRIVVLKPSSAKANGAKSAVSSMHYWPQPPQSEGFLEEQEDEGAREVREVAKEITQQMRENLAGHRRDETLFSSVFSNGYTGDESSFEKSENDFADGNLSDSEVMSPPTSRHSWDYLHRFGSPYPMSSLSRASYSPESSVCREAKKRLSERWAMTTLTSSGSNQEQRHFRRSSSTLGEMLALSEIKKSEICEGDDSQDSRASTSCINDAMGVRESKDYDSPKNLMRSRSVPVSSAAYGQRPNVKVFEPVVYKGDDIKEIARGKAPTKSLFTGKVTSLFFSRKKKSRKENSTKLQSNDESQLTTPEIIGSLTPSGSLSNGQSEVVSPSSRLHSGNALVDINDKRLGQVTCSHQGAVSVSQPCTSGHLGESQDQPSPISVLEQSFEEDDSSVLSSTFSIDPTLHVPPCLSKSNLIDKSPPIGSIARMLSLDECCTQTATSYPLNSPFVSPGAEDDEGEWLNLVQSLLTMAGLNDKGQVGLNLAKWHSPESPLDPLLRDKYIDLAAKEPLHEGKRRQLRSSRKLVFDCVNSALVDIGFRIPAFRWSEPHIGGPNRVLESGSTLLAHKVLAWMKELFSSEVTWLSLDGRDDNSLVERLVVKEIVDQVWVNQMKFEMDKIGKEIEGKLLEELVEESVVEWTDRD